jgi:hypothetical protein
MSFLLPDNVPTTAAHIIVGKDSQSYNVGVYFTLDTDSTLSEETRDIVSALKHKLARYVLVHGSVKTYREQCSEEDSQMAKGMAVGAWTNVVAKEEKEADEVNGLRSTIVTSTWFHGNHTCNNCNNERNNKKHILGFRYSCTTCGPFYDLCQDCYKRFKQQSSSSFHDTNHSFKPVVSSEVQRSEMTILMEPFSDLNTLKRSFLRHIAVPSEDTVKHIVAPITTQGGPLRTENWIQVLKNALSQNGNTITAMSLPPAIEVMRELKLGTDIIANLTDSAAGFNLSACEALLNKIHAQMQGNEVVGAADVNVQFDVNSSAKSIIQFYSIITYFKERGTKHQGLLNIFL